RPSVEYRFQRARAALEAQANAYRQDGTFSQPEYDAMSRKLFHKYSDPQRQRAATHGVTVPMPSDLKSWSAGGGLESDLPAWQPPDTGSFGRDARRDALATIP